MGTKSKTPTRDEQRQFAADKFRFLRQVAYNPELPPLASKFAIHLLSRFNLEYDGIGWAGQDTLAEDLGCVRETVNRWFKLFVKHGHLTYKRGGWGKSNRYRMAFKEEASEVSSHQEETTDATDVTPASHQEETTEITDVTPASQSDVTPASHESILSSDGAATLPPEREIGSCAAASFGGPGLRPPPRRQGGRKAGRSAGPSGSAGAGAGANGDAAAVPHLQDLAVLRGQWARGHVRDATPRELKAQDEAWTAAMDSGAAPEAIFAGVPKWKARYEASMLPVLSDWLITRSWEKEPPPPPNKKANGSNGKGNGHWHHRKSKKSRSSFLEEVGVEEVAPGVFRDIPGRAH